MVMVPLCELDAAKPPMPVYSTWGYVFPGARESVAQSKFFVGFKRVY